MATMNEKNEGSVFGKCRS